MTLEPLTRSYVDNLEIDRIDPAAFDYPALTYREHTQPDTIGAYAEYQRGSIRHTAAHNWGNREMADEFKVAVDEFNRDPRAGWAFIARARAAHRAPKLAVFLDSAARQQAAIANLEAIANAA